MITSLGGTSLWTSGLGVPADLSAVNGIKIVGSNNTYETTVTLTFDSDNRDSGTITFGTRPGEIQVLTQFNLVTIVDSVTSNHTVTGVNGETGLITFTPALVGDLQSPTFFETLHTYVTDANGLEDIRYNADNKLLAGATYQGEFNDNNGFNVCYLRGVNVSSLGNGDGTFTIPRLYTDNNDIVGSQLDDWFVYRRRNGFRPAFRNIAFNDSEVVEAIQFDPILDLYWESNTVEGIKVFTDAIDVIKNDIEKGVEVSNGTVSIETVANSNGIPNNHNSIYRRIELADNEQLITGTKTAYGGRSSKFARVFDLDNPIQDNLAVLNPSTGLTLLIRNSLFKGTGASTINGYNVGDNLCEIDVVGTESLEIDIEGNAGGTGIRLTQGGNAFLSLNNSTWNAESVSSAITNNLLSSNITTIGNQTYQGGCLLSNTTLTTAAGDITCDAALQGTTSTIDLDAGTLTASGATTFIVNSTIDVDTIAMGSTFGINDSTIISNFITGGALSMANNSRLEIFNDVVLSGTMDDSVIIADGRLQLTGDTDSMTITGFDGNEVVVLDGTSLNDIVENTGNISINANTTGSRFGTLSNPAGSITFAANISILDTDAYSGGTITLANTVGSSNNGSNSIFNASTITQPQTTGNSITRCNLTGTNVTVVNATDCIMDGSTTNTVVGDSLRNVWLHDGRVNPGAGVTTPTSTEDTITVNGVDLRLTGNIVDLRVGSGIRAGYIATLNNFTDGIVDCEQLFVDKDINGSTIDTYQLNSTDFPGNDVITSNITIGKLLSTDADQPTSQIRDNVSSSISLRHNTRLNLEGTQQDSTSASTSGPTDTNTAQVEFGKPVLGGFLTDITILSAATSDSTDWSPISFDNVDIDATNTGRIRFQSTGDVNILRGPQHTGGVSDFDQSSSALQAWKEDSPGFVNLDFVGSDGSIAPIPIADVNETNGWSTLIVDQRAADGGKVWKLIRGTETSESDVYNVRAEAWNFLENEEIVTDVSVSNAIGSTVDLTLPASYGARPTGAGDATTPNAEVQAYYDQAPWNIELPLRPFTITFTRGGIGRMEVHYRGLDGVMSTKYIAYGQPAFTTITLDETEVAVNSTVVSTVSSADSNGLGVGLTETLIEGETLNIEISGNNLKGSSFSRPFSTAQAAARYNNATLTGAEFSQKIYLSGQHLMPEEVSEAALSQIWLEGMCNETQTANSAPMHVLLRQENADETVTNAAYWFGAQQNRFEYNEQKMSFTSTTSNATDQDRACSFMLHTGTSATADIAQNIATLANEYFSIFTVPTSISAGEISTLVIEDIKDFGNDVAIEVKKASLGIPSATKIYPNSGSLKE